MLVANLQDHLARNDDARQNAQDARERRRRKETNTSERASIDDVDDYVELLYEGDIDTKIRYFPRVVLMRKGRRPEHLVQHQTLMGALARVLQEDVRRDGGRVQRLQVFLSFSNSWRCIH